MGNEGIEDFIKNYNEESDEGHFLEVDVQYSKKNTLTLLWLTIFTRKKWNLKMLKSLLLIYKWKNYEKNNIQYKFMKETIISVNLKLIDKRFICPRKGLR